MDKIAGILLIAILAIISVASLTYYLLNQPTEPASIPEPSVPEFTVELVDTSYDVPTTYSTDPYTGETVTHEGYRVERRTIEVKIENQLFTPYIDSDGHNIEFYYNIRIKGHYEEEWDELDNVYDAGEMPTQSNSTYTVVDYNSEGEHTFILGTTSTYLEVTPNGQVDFQVEAMIGYTYEGYSGWRFWAFVGEKSGWSNTQTLTIP